MSFLWHKRSKKITISDAYRPSPAQTQNMLFYHVTYKRAIKRISVSTFFRCKLKAGMTVEAAFLLPIFLIAFLNILSAVEMIRLHGNLQMALWNTGNKMSVYGTVILGTEADPKTKELGELMKEAGDLAFSYGYVKGEVTKNLGKEYLDESPLMSGAGGLTFVESEIFTGNDTFEIIMTYEVKTWFPMEGFSSFRMANRYYGHVWNGYRSPGNEDNAEVQTVYIAENASVYHTDRGCTHLSLTINSVPLSGVVFERNIYGKKYTLCEKCGKGDAPGVVFVGIEGDRYHYRRNCPGLKRTIYSMSLQEAKKHYRLCSRCAQKIK